jgi:hypothetical protein
MREKWVSEDQPVGSMSKFEASPIMRLPSATAFPWPCISPASQTKNVKPDPEGLRTSRHCLPGGEPIKSLLSRASFSDVGSSLAPVDDDIVSTECHPGELTLRW